jgi:hypothetical protein
VLLRLAACRTRVSDALLGVNYPVAESSIGSQAA